MNAFRKLLASNIIFVLAAIIIGGIFFINNRAAADTVIAAPTGVIVAPGDNSSIKNGTVLAVQTKDNNGSGVDKVLFYYYDTVANQIGNDVNAGDNGVYSINWNASSLPDGQYLIFAAVYEKAGNFSVTAPITVSLDNLPPVISSVEASNPRTVQITFNEALQNIVSPAGFTIYRNGNEDVIGISSLNSVANVLTFNLTTPLKAADSPTFLISAGAIADTAGNKNADNLSGVIKEKSNPTIILKGESVVSVDVNTIYNDAGAVCNDFANDNPGLSIIGGVNTKVAGIYVLLYNCADAAGNQAVQVQRTVVVKNRSDVSYSYSACQNIIYGEWGSCLPVCNIAIF